MKHINLIFCLLLIAPWTNAQELKISPNVVYVDADEIKDIHNNICIVSKGDKQALVDLSGKFIVPYGKYTFMSFHYFDNLRNKTDLFAASKQFEASNTQITDFIKSDGSVAFSGLPSIVLERRKEGEVHPFVLENGNNRIKVMNNESSTGNVNHQSYLYFDFKGNQLFKKFNLNRVETKEYIHVFGYSHFFNYYDNTYYSDENIKYYQATNSITLIKHESFMQTKYSGGTKYGLIDKDGIVVIPIEYDAPLSFNDGMICAGKINEFGEMKYGFINEKNEVVIPFKYSIRPGNFHEGLALVQPKTATEFAYAYIDKTGEIKISIPSINERGYGAYVPFGYKYNTNNELVLLNIGYFLNGYSIWKNSKTDKVELLDKNGHFTPFEEFIPEIEFRPKAHFKGYNDLGIIYEFQRPNQHLNSIGIVNLNKQLLFPSSFSSIAVDKKGSYALATYTYVPYTVKNDTPIKGIINRNGEFILLPKAPDKW